MKEIEPLFRIFPDEGLIALETGCADLLDILFSYVIIDRQADIVKIDMKFPFFYIIDTGHDRGLSTQMKNSRPLGAVEWAIEKGDHRSLVEALIQADNQDSVSFECLLIMANADLAVQVFKACAVPLSLPDKIRIGQGIALLLIDEADRKIVEVKPGEIRLKPEPVKGRQNHSIPLRQGLVQFFSP